MNTQVDFDILKVTIITPKEKLYTGEADAVSSVNRIGKFDILPQHENFISIIKDYVIVRTKSGEQRFELQEAILKAERNTVHVFVEVGAIN